MCKEQISEMRMVVEEYYRKIKRYLESDIKALIDCDQSGRAIGCGAYLLIACSAIDFLGALAYAGESEEKYSGRRSQGYIKKYIGEVDTVYKDERVAEYIYKVIRCGQVHEAIAKCSSIIGTSHERDFHLKIIALPQESNSKKIVKGIYFNPQIFAIDLLASLDLFEKELKDDPKIEKMYNFLKLQRDEALEYLRNNKPTLQEKDVDETTFGELYNFSSATPHFAGGARLKEEYLEFLIEE